jgi:dUTP pyrophosphatase
LIVQYSKTRANARTPVRANPSDAGLDVFYSPEEEEVAGKWIVPGKSSLFSTGLKFGIPHGYMLEVKNRSGMAAKRSLIVGACVVDSGYTGEVFINLHNIGSEPQFIPPGEKIAQVVMTPVVHFNAQETSSDRLYAEPITISSRGEGALGSTDG